MKTIYLVRHAKAEGQPRKALLTEKGREQATALAEFFRNKKIDAIYSSPYLRAMDTIKPTASEKNLEIVEDSRLEERVLSNTDFEDWQEKLKLSFEDFGLCFEGGESQAAGMERAVSLLEEIIEAKAENIILVSHGNLTLLMLRFFNESFGFDQLMEMTNPDVFEIVVSSEQTLLNRIWDDRL